MRGVNELIKGPCAEYREGFRQSKTKEEKCSALFALKACVNQKEGFLVNRGFIRGMDATPGQLQRAQERSARVVQRIAELDCK